MKSRAVVIAACAVGIAAVMLLAPALGELRFEAARPLASPPNGIRTTILPDLRILENTSLGEIVFIWFAILIPILLAVLLLPPELRKKVLQQVVRFALFILTLALALRYRLINLPVVESMVLASGQAGIQTLAGPTEVGTFTPPVLPPWAIYLISFCLVALLASGFYMVYRFWQRSHSRRHLALREIAAAARQSLRQLSAGRHWGDVVVEAYARMAEAVRVARGLDRDVSWTPREFAQYLIRKGLPASAVDELTRLFEAARYGGRVADETARRRAAACLDAILQACGAGT